MKEWEEARCPVCMEHPHNAVLLLCSSHEKGCRPYMCDTSYRHSNCLDQFCKSSSDSSSSDSPSTMPHLEEASVSATTLPLMVSSEDATTDLQGERSEEGSFPLHTVSCEHQVKPKLLCPLCRGEINGWIIVDPARRFMNAKLRSCASETCEFSGSYTDLRKHARVEHPFVRPCEADPERQRTWRRLERQRDLGDLLSTLQSSFGEERGEDSVLPIDEGGGWLTVFLLIRVFQPGTSPRSSSWSGTSRRARAQLSVRRRSTRLWGESYDRESGSASRDDDNESSDGGSGPWRRQTRRRTTPDNQVE